MNPSTASKHFATVIPSAPRSGPDIEMDLSAQFSKLVIVADMHDEVTQLDGNNCGALDNLASKCRSRGSSEEATEAVTNEQGRAARSSVGVGPPKVTVSVWSTSGQFEAVILVDSTGSPRSVLAAVEALMERRLCKWFIGPLNCVRKAEAPAMNRSKSVSQYSLDSLKIFLVTGLPKRPGCSSPLVMRVVIASFRLQKNKWRGCTLARHLLIQHQSVGKSKTATHSKNAYPTMHCSHSRAIPPGRILPS